MTSVSETLSNGGRTIKMIGYLSIGLKLLSDDRSDSNQDLHILGYSSVYSS